MRLLRIDENVLIYHTNSGRGLVGYYTIKGINENDSKNKVDLVGRLFPAFEGQLAHE